MGYRDSLIRSFAVCVTLLLAAVSALNADVLVLSNGDRLTGKKVSESEGVVVFQSDLLGEISVPVENIETIEVSEETAPKKEVAGEVAPRPKKPEKTEETELPPGAKASAMAAEEARPIRFEKWAEFWEDNAVFRTLARIYPLKDWQNRMELGLNYLSGEAEKQSFNFRLRTQREKAPHSIRIDGSYRTSRTETSPGVITVTENRVQASARYRYAFRKGFFIQSDTRYNRQPIKGIFSEMDESVGVGYKWLDSKRWSGTVTPNFGMGYQRIGTEDGEVSFFTSFLQDVEFNVSDRLTLSEESNLTYVPGDEGSYKWNGNLNLENKLNSRLSLNLRYEVTYDQRVADNVDQTWQSVSLSLGADF